MADAPTFRYHPDPVGTESAVRSDEVCDVCGRPAGLRYAGPRLIFGRQPEVLCLRCIADGAAAVSLGSPDGSRAEFTDVGWGVPDDVPQAVLEEISQRTPGFIGWQQEHWLYHCADAAAFLGRVSWDDVRHLPDALASLRADLAQLSVDTAAADEQIAAMDRDGELTGYLFRCLHCGTHLAYSDAS
ncbi:CbrC family protein [Kribbella sp.]|uniref:CbrC family protein n=1 Tax=Kribbella sp. TaxID=1871183 RepID=UPI002D36C259|nr:CbrC family protein [Kribbella sp.]HZX07267.1 CbrC family protein [Kribbella sp.]